MKFRGRFDTGTGQVAGDFATVGALPQLRDAEAVRCALVRGRGVDPSGYTLMNLK